MSADLPCGCAHCKRFLAEMDDETAPPPATQEDFLCDPCRQGICAGAMRYNKNAMLNHVIETLEMLRPAFDRGVPRGPIIQP